MPGSPYGLGLLASVFCLGVHVSSELLVLCFSLLSQLSLFLYDLSMAISPADAAYQLAHAKESKVGELIGSTAALTALATALVVARFISRVYTKVGLKGDDWAILLALILCWGSFVTNVYGKSNLYRNVLYIRRALTVA